MRMTYARAPRIRERGFILAVALLMVVIFATVAASTQQLTNLNSRLIDAKYVRIAAEKAAQAGIAQTTYAMRKLGGAWTASLDADVGQGPDNTITRARYRVTFDKSRRDLPWSVNNLGSSDSAVDYFRNTLPPGCAEIISEGTYDGQGKVYIVVLVDSNVQIRNWWWVNPSEVGMAPRLECPTAERILNEI